MSNDNLSAGSIMLDRLGNSIAIIKGKKPSVINLEPISDSALPYILIESFGGKYRQFTDDATCKRAYEDDVLLVWDGERAGLSSYGHSGYIGSTLAAIRVKDTKLKPNYLFRIFEKEREWLRGNSEGTGVPHLSRWAVENIIYFKPPLPEQQKIATILSSVDDVIEKTRAQIDKLKGLKTGMMQELLTKGIGHTEFKDSPVGRIPKNWKVSQIGDIAQVNPRLLNKPEMTTLVSFLRMQDVSNDAKILAKTTRKYADVCKGFTSFSDGDVLFAKITPCMENGKGAFVEGLMNGIGFGSTEFHVLRATNNDVARWLFHLLSGKQFREKAAQFMTGSAGQRRVPTDFLKMVEVAMPACNSEMRSIVSALDALDKRVTHKELHVESIQNIKKALMQDLLTGKVRVKLTDKESAVV